jgi:hypothetical protein
MTQEDKELLLKDLCARLPYKVMIKSVGENKVLGLWDLKDIDSLPIPYLRSMSSMTEEEEEEYHKTMAWSGDILNEKIGIWVPTINSSDYLIAHHFDYRGLIPKGLALEAPEGMYIIT